MIGIKIQNMAALFKETFEATIKNHGIDNFYFCGKKMYVRLKNSFVVSVEFTGTEIAYNNIVMMACNRVGILDQNITPFKMIFKDTKVEMGHDKMINLKQISNKTGTFTAIWISELPEDDVEALNIHLQTYMALFSSI